MAQLPLTKFLNYVTPYLFLDLRASEFNGQILLYNLLNNARMWRLFTVNNVGWLEGTSLNKSAHLRYTTLSGDDKHLLINDIDGFRVSFN